MRKEPKFHIYKNTLLKENMLSSQKIINNIIYAYKQGLKIDYRYMKYIYNKKLQLYIFNFFRETLSGISFNNP